MLAGLKAWFAGAKTALLCGAALALFVAGMHLGTRLERGSQAQERVAAAEETLGRFVDAMQQGQRDAQALQGDLQAGRQYADQLKRSLRNVTVIARVQPDASAAAASSPAGAAPSPAVDLYLSHGAVSVWNSAQAGAVMPSGACRADDPTSRACAAAAEVTVNDAWDNQGVNAALCREDRLKYQRLIDHLRKRLANQQRNASQP